MGNATAVGIIVALVFGAAFFGYEGFHLRSENSFLSYFSAILAIGCVTGAIAIGILTPIYNGQIEALNQQIRGLQAARAKQEKTPSRLRPVPTITFATPTSTPLSTPVSQEVHVSTDYLMELARRGTNAQAQELLQPFIGKRIEVSGKVGDVRENKDGTSTVYFYPVLHHQDVYEIVMEFGPIWSRRTLALSEGSRIKVKGTIRDITTLWIGLRDCEFQPAP